MPYSLRKVPGKSCYSVRRRGSGPGRVKSRCTSLSRAKKQLRLLYALDRPGFVPRGRTILRSRG